MMDVLWLLALHTTLTYPFHSILQGSSLGLALVVFQLAAEPFVCLHSCFVFDRTVLVVVLVSGQGGICTAAV